MTQAAGPLPSDEELMRAFRAGERWALGELIARHKTAAYNFALRQVRQPDLASDVVQDAFVRVVQGATEFRESARFSTWLFTIIRNLCIDHARKQVHRRHPSLDAQRPGEDGEGPTLGDLVPDPNVRIDREAEGPTLRKRIQTAVDALPDEQREVFLLREVANLAFKEIAEVTGVPENTVKSRMRYALERLQEALAEYEELARTL